MVVFQTVSSHMWDPAARCHSTPLQMQQPITLFAPCQVQQPIATLSPAHTALAPLTPLAEPALLLFLQPAGSQIAVACTIAMISLTVGPSLIRACANLHLVVPTTTFLTLWQLYFFPYSAIYYMP